MALDEPATRTLSEQNTAGGKLARVNPFRVMWGIVTHVDRAKINPWQALRNTVGVVVPLIIGFAWGMPRGGVAMASGALNVSYSDGSDPYKPRAKRMLTSTIWCSIAVLLGGLTAHSNTIAVVIATIWAFAAGMLVALGSAAADVGVISTVVLLVYSAQALSPLQALQASGLALAGGTLQILLSVALWRVQRYEPERRSLAALYSELARIATIASEATAAPLASKQLAQAHEALANLATETSLASLRYRSLLSQGERVRLSLTTLARLRARLTRADASQPGIAALDRYRANAAVLLNAIAESLSSGKELEREADRLAFGIALAEQLPRASQAGSPSFLEAAWRDVKFQTDALGGQLRAAMDLAQNTTRTGEAEFEKRDALQPLWMRFTSRIATLIANLNLHSSAFRHTVRLSAAVAAGDALGRVIHPHRAYWIPMTIVLVLKPEFAVTFSRGVLRIFGTLLGLLLATALFHFLPIHTVTEILLILIFTFLTRWVGPANYGIFGVAISALIVLLISITGIAPKEVIAARGLNTIIGGAFALIAYATWPTWERSRLPELFAMLLEAYANSVRSITQKLVEPSASSIKERERTRQAARIARSNLETSIERLPAEPGVSAQTLAQANSMLASSHRFAHALIALEAGAGSSGGPPPSARFPMFAASIEKTLRLLAGKMRAQVFAEKDFPDLREEYDKFKSTEGNDKTDLYAFIFVEADRMTNSLNTLREQIFAWKRETRS